MTKVLTIRMPNGRQYHFPLLGEHAIIGRSDDCDIVLDYDYVSRQHAKIERQREMYSVADLGSRNGTWVNGRPISQVQHLAEGDEIKIGDVILKFGDAGAGLLTTAPFRVENVRSPIVCDAATYTVTIEGTALSTRLSLQEFDLLSTLASRYGEVLTRDQLGSALWGKGNFDYNLLHRLVHRLKDKLGEEYGTWVQNIPGRGYKLMAPETSQPDDDAPSAAS